MNFIIFKKGSLLLSAIALTASLTTEANSNNNKEELTSTGITIEKPSETTEKKAFIKQSGTALALYGPGDMYSMLVIGEESTNSLFQFEATVPPNGGPPPHVHSEEEETFYIVEGELEFQIDDKYHIASKGDFVYIPPGTVHRFKNIGDTTSTMLVTFSPSRMDGFFLEVFPVVKNKNLMNPPTMDQLMEKMDKAAAKYGMTYITGKD